MAAGLVVEQRQRPRRPVSAVLETSQNSSGDSTIALCHEDCLLACDIREETEVACSTSKCSIDVQLRPRNLYATATACPIQTSSIDRTSRIRASLAYQPRIESRILVQYPNTEPRKHLYTQYSGTTRFAAASDGAGNPNATTHIQADLFPRQDLRSPWPHRRQTLICTPLLKRTTVTSLSSHPYSTSPIIFAASR